MMLMGHHWTICDSLIFTYTIKLCFFKAVHTKKKRRLILISGWVVVIVDRFCIILNHLLNHGDKVQWHRIIIICQLYIVTCLVLNGTAAITHTYLEDQWPWVISVSGYVRSCEVRSSWVVANVMRGWLKMRLGTEVKHKKVVLDSNWHHTFESFAVWTFGTALRSHRLKYGSTWDKKFINMITGLFQSRPQFKWGDTSRRTSISTLRHQKRSSMDAVYNPKDVHRLLIELQALKTISYDCIQTLMFPGYLLQLMSRGCCIASPFDVESSGE